MFYILFEVVFLAHRYMGISSLILSFLLLLAAVFLICSTQLLSCAKQEAVELLKDGIALISEADRALSNLLSYPLFTTLAR